MSDFHEALRRQDQLSNAETAAAASDAAAKLRFSASMVILSRPSASGFNLWLLQIVHWWFWRTQGQ